MTESGKIVGIVFGVTLIPIAIVLGLVGLVFVVIWFERQRESIPPELGYWTAGLIAAFFVGAILLGMMCFRVYPQEAFQDGSAGDPTLLADIATTEAAVCKLITRVDGFLQNDVGAPGLKDPGLVSEAQTRARAGIDMVVCSGDDASGEAAHRITRLEETLRSFTAPELQRTYDTAMKCEGFQSPSLRDRLTAVQVTLQDQQNRLLAPIDQKTADLHKGIASDCDKRRGTAHMNTTAAKT